MNLHDFLDMGGYAPYVWSCYGLTLTVLVGMGVNARRRWKSEVLRATRRARSIEQGAENTP
jgi:heme exporter protein D